MPIVFGDDSLLTRFVWESANFASGGGTTNLGWEISATTEVAVLDAVEAIIQAWNVEMRPGTDSDITLVSVAWETATISGDVAANLPGTSNLVCPPPNAATLVTYNALGKGPRNRGRNYWPGLVSETSVDERGVITPGVVTALQTRIDAFFAAALAPIEVTAQAIAQSVTDSTVTAPIVPWPQVRGRTVQPIMATQRRRLRR